MKPHPRIIQTVMWGGAVVAVLALLLVVGIVGRKPGGPTSTQTNSAGMTTLVDRTKFLHEYVRFRRTYETLDFDIEYHNNGGGMVPGPSDWDVRLVATVPASEISAWVPTGIQSSRSSDTEWLKSVPTKLDVSGVSEWYVDGQRVVGLDRGKRIVVYRSSTSLH